MVNIKENETGDKHDSAVPLSLGSWRSRLGMRSMLTLGGIIVRAYCITGTILKNDRHLDIRVLPNLAQYSMMSRLSKCLLTIIARGCLDIHIMVDANLQCINRLHHQHHSYASQSKPAAGITRTPNTVMNFIPASVVCLDRPVDSILPGPD
jgi:hypothetical protein